MSFSFRGRLDQSVTVEEHGIFRTIIAATDIVEILDKEAEVFSDERLFDLFLDGLRCKRPFATGPKLFGLEFDRGPDSISARRLKILVEACFDPRDEGSRGLRLADAILAGLERRCPGLSEDRKRYGMEIKVELFEPWALRSHGISYVHV